MKRFFTITFVFLLTLHLSYAQSNTASNDPAAKVILDKVAARFKTYKGVKAGFEMKVESSTGKILANSTGTLLMQGKKYRISTKEQEIFSDGIDLWTYDPNTNEVQISKVDPSEDQITPQKLFSNFYDKDFLYKLNGEKKSGDKVLVEIEMTPTNKAKSFHKVIVLIDKGANTIVGTKVLEKNGNRFTYTVTHFNGNEPIAAKQFLFNAAEYPGVEVIDLR